MKINEAHGELFNKRPFLRLVKGKLYKPDARNSLIKKWKRTRAAYALLGATSGITQSRTVPHMNLRR
jgi:hypothetical protein